MRALLIAALLTIPAGATAADRFFHSPSGNIECELSKTFAYCQTGVPARSATLKPNGHTKVCRGRGCIGNGPEDATTLRYGHSIRKGPFRCTSHTNGMRCVVRATGHGFRISRAGVKRF